MSQKLLFLVSFVCLFLVKSHAQKTYPLSVGGEIIINTDSLKLVKTNRKLVDTVWNEEVRTISGIPVRSDVKIWETALLVNLSVNERISADSNFIFDSIRIRFKVDYYTNDAIAKSKTFTLKIENTNNSSLHKDNFLIYDVQWSKITIDSFYSSVAIPDSYKDLFNVSYVLQGRQTYPPNVLLSMSPPSFEEHTNKSYLKLQWNHVLWAESYDLEWCFVDRFAKNQTPDFRFNATRINISVCYYEFPLIFQQGKIYFRIRPKGIRADGTMAVALWSNVSRAFEISNINVFEKSTKTWQHKSVFAENGLRKDLISFYDGSARERQVITKLNTDGNHLIVGETFYDYEGRATIKTLPTPYKPALETTYELAGFKPDNLVIGSPTWKIPYSPYPKFGDKTKNKNVYNGKIDDSGYYQKNNNLPGGFKPVDIIDHGSLTVDWGEVIPYYSESPSLKYISHFNLNSNSEVYNRQNFDFSLEDCNRHYTPDMMSTASGAGKYYSPNNDIISIHSDFIPDAKGFPYVQMHYTPDLTGRLESQGAAGDSLGIGSGHESKMFYTVPSQSELDRIFGNDVGFAKHYTKTIVQDPNGQLIVQYKNSKGQLVASALGGETPNNLMEVEKERQELNVVNIIDQSNQLIDQNSKSIARQTIFIEDNNTLFNINYSIDPTIYQIPDPCNPTRNFCYDCPKNLMIKLIDDCGSIKFIRNVRIGPIQDTSIRDLTNCRSATIVRVDTSLRLNKGSYFIEKSLSIDESAKDQYIMDYIQKDTACSPVSIKPPVCLTQENCTPCRFEELMYGNRKIYKRVLGNKLNCKRKCIGTPTTMDVATYEMLLQDLRPGGQYGCIDTGSNDCNKVSVFNTRSNLLGNTSIIRAGGLIPESIPFNYQHPAFSYLNNDGSEALIRIDDLPLLSYSTSNVVFKDGYYYVRPQDIIDLVILSRIWQESWTESLVHMHPEYAYFEWNSEHMNSIHYDQNIQDTLTYAGAIASQYLKEDESLDLSYVQQDPFFSNPVLAVHFLDKLKNKSQIVVRGTPRSLSIYEVVKLTAFCNLPVYNANMELLENCISTNHINSLDREGKEYVWKTFRGIYQSTKARIVDSLRTEALFITPGRLLSRMNNHCIDSTQFIRGCNDCLVVNELNNILKKKSRRVFHIQCINGNTIPIVDTVGRLMGSRTIEESVILNTLGWMNCSHTCPQGFDFQNFLNAIALSGKLNNIIVFPNIPPLAIPSSLVNGFPNPMETKYEWRPRISGNTISVSIVDGNNRLQASFELQNTERIDWNKIKFFSCLQGRPSRDRLTSSTNEFTMNAFDQNNHLYHLNLRITNGINLNLCEEITIGSNNLKFNFNNQTVSIGGKNGKGKTIKLNSIPEINCCVQLTPQNLNDESCQRWSELVVIAESKSAKLERANRLLDSLGIAYNKACLKVSNEHFNVSWNQPIYHFTLFYYDQAGNLIQTVPPAAIRIITDVSRVSTNRIRNGSERLYPSHIFNLATLYTYNSLGQKLTRTTPDGGLSKWSYDRVGRILFSQNSEQESDREISYINYDSQNRIIEGGIATTSPTIQSFFTRANSKYREQFIPALASLAGKKEVTRTIYDESILVSSESSRFISGYQLNLRGRVASTLYKEIGVPSNTKFDHGMHFSYDIVGNNKELLQDFASLSDLLSNSELNRHEKKLVRYDFDILTGKVKQAAYQPGQIDQFYHWYLYDADNRIVGVETGRSRFETEESREKDASYKYYLHGPVARSEIGHQKIQGMDLIYTINGWLKQLNSPSTNLGDDFNSMDHVDGFLPDVFAMHLNYFDRDYSASQILSPSTSLSFANNPSLYNGNIQKIIFRNDGLGSEQGGNLTTQLYRYDQLNQLRTMKLTMPNSAPGSLTSTGDEYWNGSALSWDAGTHYNMNINYDKNGNITTLNRSNFENTVFDQLDYNYYSNSNRLQDIGDRASTSLPDGNDLSSQPARNYEYDHLGRLTRDQSESSSLEWNSRDKLKRYAKAGRNTNFVYDPLGRRVLKHYNDTANYTVRDFSGRVIAVYHIQGGIVSLDEVPIYAQERIGTWQPENLIAERLDTIRFNLIRGEKVYELKNQTGDVMSLVSDHRLIQIDSVGGSKDYISDIVLAKDYFPFGMEMPGRISESHRYRYGFQGMERDDDLKKSGNSYTTEFRQYDPRVGRWLSLDPKAELFAQLTPFNAHLNNPVYNTDPKGDCPPCVAIALGAGIGVVAGLASEGISYAITGQVTGGAEGMAARLLISATAGALTGGVGALEIAGATTVQVVGTRVILSVAIEATANVGSQVSDNHFRTDAHVDIDFSQAAVAGAFGALGPLADQATLMTRTAYAADRGVHTTLRIMNEIPPAVTTPASRSFNRSYARVAGSFTEQEVMASTEVLQDVTGALIDVGGNATQAALFSSPPPPTVQEAPVVQPSTSVSATQVPQLSQTGPVFDLERAGRRARDRRQIRDAESRGGYEGGESRANGTSGTTGCNCSGGN